MDFPCGKLLDACVIFCFYFEIILDDQYQKLEEMLEEANIEIVSRISGTSVDIERSRLSEFNLLATRNRRIFKQLPEVLNPFDKVEWAASGLFLRFLILIKVPITFVLLLVVPVVDYELPRHGWCKLLNSAQIVLMPMTVFYVLCKYYFYRFYFCAMVCLFVGA